MPNTDTALTESKQQPAEAAQQPVRSGGGWEPWIIAVAVVLAVSVATVSVCYLWQNHGPPSWHGYGKDEDRDTEMAMLR